MNILLSLAAMAEISGIAHILSANTSSDPISYILQIGGPLGVIVVLVVTGKFVSSRELDRSDARAIAAEKREQDTQAKYDALQEKFSERLVPMITEVTRVLTEVGRVLQIPPGSTLNEQRSTNEALLHQMSELAKAVKDITK